MWGCYICWMNQWIITPLSLGNSQSDCMICLQEHEESSGSEIFSCEAHFQILESVVALSKRLKVKTITNKFQKQ